MRVVFGEDACFCCFFFLFVLVFEMSGSSNSELSIAAANISHSLFSLAACSVLSSTAYCLSSYCCICSSRCHVGEVGLIMIDAWVLSYCCCCCCSRCCILGVEKISWDIDNLIFCCNDMNWLVVIMLMISTGGHVYYWCWFGQVVAWTGFMDIGCHGQKIKRSQKMRGS